MSLGQQKGGIPSPTTQAYVPVWYKRYGGHAVGMLLDFGDTH